jgi:signal transduction histidine kinase
VWLFGAGALLAAAAGAGAGAVLRRQASHPLRTAANVLDAMRHGDYTHRARTDIVHGAVAHLLGEINHLAQHLQAERARAEETAALLQALVDRVDVALLAFDDQGLLRWWNPAADRLFSTKLRVAVSARELGAEELLTGASERSVGLPGHDPSSVWELRRGVFHRAGQRYQFLLLSSAQRVRREEERAAWQRLLRVLGHEVNNSLAPIQSMAGTLASLALREPLPEDWREDFRGGLELIGHRAGALSRFLASYSQLTRLPPPRPGAVALPELLDKVARLDARRPVQLESGPSVTVNVDADQLEQALINLVRNAVEASLPVGGEVLLRWREEPDRVVIEVLDEGEGPPVSDNLFVPFFTTKPGGSGIGLALARQVAEAHEGGVSLLARADTRGAVATLWLPQPAEHREPP